VPKNISVTVEESLRQSNSIKAEEVKTREAPTEDGTHDASQDACICEEKASHAEPESQEPQPSGRMWFELLKAQKKSASKHAPSGSGSQTREIMQRLSVEQWQIMGPARWCQLQEEKYVRKTVV